MPLKTTNNTIHFSKWNHAIPSLSKSPFPPEIILTLYSQLSHFVSTVSKKSDSNSLLLPLLLRRSIDSNKPRVLTTSNVPKVFTTFPLTQFTMRDKTGGGFKIPRGWSTFRNTEETARAVPGRPWWIQGRDNLQGRGQEAAGRQKKPGRARLRSGPQGSSRPLRAPLTRSSLGFSHAHAHARPIFTFVAARIKKGRRAYCLDLPAWIRTRARICGSYPRRL